MAAATGSCLARRRTASGRLITSATARPRGGVRRAVSAGTPGRCWAASRTAPAARPAAGTAAFLPGVVLPGVLRPVRDGPPAAPAAVLAVRGLLAVRGAPAVVLAVLAAVAVLLAVRVAGRVLLAVLAAVAVLLAVRTAGRVLLAVRAADRVWLAILTGSRPAVLPALVAVR